MRDHPPTLVRFALVWHGLWRKMAAHRHGLDFPRVSDQFAERLGRFWRESSEMLPLKSATPDVKTSWLSMALQAGKMGSWYWDLASDKVTFDDMQTTLMGIGLDGQTLTADDIFSRMHAEDAPSVQAAVEAAIRTESTYSAEFRFSRPDGHELWLGARGDVITDPNDGGKYLAGVNWDITPEKERELRAEMVSKEMGHRMKNIVAVIGGVSRMTAQASSNLQEFQVAFNQRLTALAGLNNLILGEEEREPSVNNLVRDTLYGVAPEGRIGFDIDAFEVNDQAAQTIVLAINELATNAIKYGALEDPDGSVKVAVTVDESSDEFTLSWTETRGRPIKTDSQHRGFGTKVLMSLTASTFGGNPSYDWHTNGLHYTCVWKASEMAIA